MRTEYLELIRQGSRRGEAAHQLGVTRATVTAAMRDKAGNLTPFGKAVVEAEHIADDTVEHALYDAACSGNVSAIQTWLYNRRANQWADKKGAAAIAIAGASSSSSLEVQLTVSAKQALLGRIRTMGANLSSPIFSPLPAEAPSGELTAADLESLDDELIVLDDEPTPYAPSPGGRPRNWSAVVNPDEAARST